MSAKARCGRPSAGLVGAIAGSGGPLASVAGAGAGSCLDRTWERGIVPRANARRSGDMSVSELDTPTDELRREAVSRLQKRSDFWMHFAGYVMFNAALVLAWIVMDGEGLFWPIFPL